MKTKEFEKVSAKLLQDCIELLNTKQVEYNSDTDDRFLEFKQAATLLGTSTEYALLSMLSKHIVSLYNLVLLEHLDLAIYTEKIKDSINYLVLLYALLIDIHKDREEPK